MLAVGIDIGGTSVKGAVVDSEGEVLTRFHMDVDKLASGEVEVNRFCDLMIKSLKEYAPCIPEHPPSSMKQGVSRSR